MFYNFFFAGFKLFLFFVRSIDETELNANACEGPTTFDQHITTSTGALVDEQWINICRMCHVMHFYHVVPSHGLAFNWFP